MDLSDWDVAQRDFWLYRTSTRRLTTCDRSGCWLNLVSLDYRCVLIFCVFFLSKFLDCEKFRRCIFSKFLFVLTQFHLCQINKVAHALEIENREFDFRTVSGQIWSATRFSPQWLNVGSFSCDTIMFCAYRSFYQENSALIPGQSGDKRETDLRQTVKSSLQVSRRRSLALESSTNSNRWKWVSRGKIWTQFGFDCQYQTRLTLPRTHQVLFSGLLGQTCGRCPV